MPLMYTGKFRGMVEHDEIHELDFGSQGVTKVGIIRPKVRNEEEARKNRANLIRIAQQVILDEMLKEQERAGDKDERNSDLYGTGNKA